MVFVAPVWMGQIASPIRSCIKELKGQLDNYAFVSISGGALNDNPKLGKDVLKRFKKEPSAVIDMHIVDLLGADKDLKMSETGSYQVNEKEIKEITEKVVGTLRNRM